MRAVGFLVPVALLLAGGARAQQPVNPLHPTVVPLDAQGQPTQSRDAVSDERTCAGCHDVAFIDSHSGHASAGVKVGCTRCHLDGGKLDVRPETLDERGALRREALRIGPPASANCASCHGLVFGARDAVALPRDFDAPDGPERNLSLTRGEGAIVAPQPMNDSFLDLEGKDRLTSPWDVHAAKLVGCTSCHFAPNDPVHAPAKQTRLRYLANDPRRVGTAEYLLRPDHRLAKQECRSCHAPQEAHHFLPYRERHLTVLACQACHTPGPRAPMLEMLDETVVTAEGKPAARWRNLDRQDGALGAGRVTAVRPLLVERAEQDGARRLAPVNPVGRWQWVDGLGRTPVPFAQVSQAFLSEGRYAPEVLAAFDANRDGRLDEAELRLDTREKTDLIAARLRTLGVRDPAIDGTLRVHALTHGIPSHEQAIRDCTECHGGESRADRDLVLATYLPGGVAPRPLEEGVDLAGVITPAGGGLVLKGEPGTAPGGLHVFGHSRHGVSNTLGFLVFLAVSLGVTIHGLVRFLLRRRRAPHGHAGRQDYVFGLYERIWHWTMATSGVVLIVTGLHVHSPGAGWPWSLPTAVALHNAFAVLLTVNAFLALFHHLVTLAIRNFLPTPTGLVKRVLEHVDYYARGIYFGRPHPANEPGQKLNPLQQLTYLALLNLLFPFQIASGALIWAVGHWPQLATALGGLSHLAPAHNLGAWLFVSFFVLHVYLVTTGRTVGEHLRSMVTGFQTVDEPEVAAPPKPAPAVNP